MSQNKVLLLICCFFPPRCFVTVMETLVNLPTVPTSQMQLELAREKALAQRKVSFQESLPVSGACGVMEGNGRDWYCEGQKEA